MECAILSNSTRDVKRLIRDGMDVNANFLNVYTPTTLASTMGNLGIVKILLDAGADPCLMTANGGDCAIHAASRHNHSNVIKELVARGYSLEVPTSDDGLRPLFIAAQNGSTDAVKTLIEEGAQLEWKHEGAYTALYTACQFGHPAVVAVLLNAGACTGRQGKHGFTPLMQSSHRGYVEVVKILLNHGCPLDTKNDQGCTALHLAAAANRVKVLVELLKRGADPSMPGPEGYTAFHLAKQGGYTEAQNLLAQSKRERQKIPPGSTPLHRCILANDFKGAATLLDDGAPPNEIDGVGLTALHRAVMGLELKAVVVLLRGGANENVAFPQVYGNGLSPTDYTYMAESMADEICSPNGAIFSNAGVQHIRRVRNLILRASALRAKSWKWPVGDGGVEPPCSGSEEEEDNSVFEDPSFAEKGGSLLAGVRCQQAGQSPGRGVIVFTAISRYAQKTS